MLTRTGLYRLGDEALSHPPNTRAQWTGQVRAPRAGDWFLSGAIITAYKAMTDLEQPYPIARLVRTETTTMTRILP